MVMVRVGDNYQSAIWSKQTFRCKEIIHHGPHHPHTPFSAIHPEIPTFTDHNTPISHWIILTGDGSKVIRQSRDKSPFTGSIRNSVFLCLICNVRFNLSSWYARNERFLAVM